MPAGSVLPQQGTFYAHKGHFAPVKRDKAAICNLWFLLFCRLRYFCAGQGHFVPTKGIFAPARRIFSRRSACSGRGRLFFWGPLGGGVFAPDGGIWRGGKAVCGGGMCCCARTFMRYMETFFGLEPFFLPAGIWGGQGGLEGRFCNLEIKNLHFPLKYCRIH